MIKGIEDGTKKPAPNCSGLFQRTGPALSRLRLSGRGLHLPQPTRRPRGDGIVRVGRQTKGRKGSGVTTVSGLPLPVDQLRDLAAQLKRQCGAGGGVKDGLIEIQGDHRDLLVAALTRLGYTVKRAGG